MNPYTFGLIAFLGLLSLVHSQSCHVSMYGESNSHVVLSLDLSRDSPTAFWFDLTQVDGFNDNVGGFTFSGDFCYDCILQLYTDVNYAGYSNILNTGDPYRRTIPLSSYWKANLSSFKLYC